jgi:hypothetical protein
MDTSAFGSEANESLPSDATPVIEIRQPNEVALEYLRKPSFSSIAVMRDAFKGLLATSD